MFYEKNGYSTGIEDQESNSHITLKLNKLRKSKITDSYWIAILLVCCLILAVSISAQAVDKYTPDWQSLSKHSVPQWFKDAKYGIYFHWGVYCVPAFGNEWYPRNMHIKDSPEYKYHLENFGEPSEFGYHDFVPMFKAQKFDADEWAELFAKSGARFAGPVAEHHDGFAMWDSELTPWNAKDKGPKRDIAGELEKAIRKRGMRFIMTFHHARNQGHYPRVEGWPTTSDDPELQMLYGNMARDKFLELWKGKLIEVIDKYQPDIMWFDSCLDEIPEKIRMEYLAYYFNKAEQWNKEVVVTYKQQDLPREVGVEDFEKGRANHITEYPWLTDDTISWGSWCYTKGLEIKTTETVLHTLIDIVSKNGVLLLNISPRDDGVIPDVQKKVLIELGEWLKINGQAIYDTRPWHTFGEGPTRLEKGGHFVGRLDYTPEDIRYTQSKDGSILYAIMLGWPKDKHSITFSSVGIDSVKTSAGVKLLGYDGKIVYRVDDKKQLVVELPPLPADKRPCQYAYAFRIEGFDMR